MFNLTNVETNEIRDSIDRIVTKSDAFKGKRFNYIHHSSLLTFECLQNYFEKRQVRRNK